MLRDLWGTGRSDFKGDYFTMNDCRVSPRPSQPMKVICAGQSDAGMAFSAQHADYNFCFARSQHANGLCPNRRTHDAGGGKTGRDVGSYVLFMVIADETDAGGARQMGTLQSGRR
ncbi:LLM class flavin-dependent oxidoreductase [Klebsiella variicola subsp. variicola]|nr:LLM class flavin-dependent oxidoreductase [Klebsiella variicola subsp. variicola]